MGFFLRILVVVSLCFAFVLSTTAVPSSRSLKSINEHKSFAQDMMRRSSSTGRNRMLVVADEGDSEEGISRQGRMLMIETNDYGGPSANKNHDPGNPGTRLFNLFTAPPPS